MNLSEAREASNSRLYHPPVAHAIAAQLIQVVAFLHSRGVVHAGNLEHVPMYPNASR